MVRIGETRCPFCGGELKHRDYIWRTVYGKRRSVRKIRVEREICIDCKKVMRTLPDEILPYRRYETEIIFGVIEGLITCETLGYEDYPCEMTMIRWTRKIQPLLCK